MRKRRIWIGAVVVVICASVGVFYTLHRQGYTWILGPALTGPTVAASTADVRLLVSVEGTSLSVETRCTRTLAYTERTVRVTQPHWGGNESDSDGVCAPESGRNMSGDDLHLAPGEDVTVEFTITTTQGAQHAEHTYTLGRDGILHDWWPHLF